MTEPRPSSSSLSPHPPPGRSMGGVYQPQLDGLRAIAIMGVLFHHFGLHIPDFLQTGPIAVRVFFALTGYFMTLWLWKAVDTAHEGGVSVWRELPVFYARRLLRIVPALYLSLLLAAVVGVDVILSHLPWHMLFASNFYVAQLGYWPPTVSHLWSLSVQEQFYLLWPLVLLFVPRKHFLGVLAGAFFIAFGYRLACILAEVEPVIRWTMLPGCLDSFATGGFIAWLGAGKVGTPIMTEKQRWGFGAVAFGCLLVARSMRHLPQTDPWVATLELWEAVFIGWLVAATAQGWRGPVGRVLSFRPLVYIGQISLGVYLFHVLIAISLGPWLDTLGLTHHAHNALRVALLALFSVGAAILSWHLWEKPLAKLKPPMVKRVVKWSPWRSQGRVDFICGERVAG